MKRKRIGLFGSAVNPPTMKHRDLVLWLLRSGAFDELIFVPSGTRRLKEDLVSGAHRRAMTELSVPPSGSRFGRTWFVIDWSDIDGANTPTAEWIRRLRARHPGDDIVPIIGSDAVVPRERYGGRSEMQSIWIDGERLWDEELFLVLLRDGFPIPSGWILPERFRTIPCLVREVSSTDVRNRIMNGEPFDHLVPDGVASYISRYGLYRT